MLELSLQCLYKYACGVSQILKQASFTHRAVGPVQSKAQSEVFEDVQLGPLLGQGGFGKVYRGLWNGAPVAIKANFLLALSKAA